MSNGSGIRGLRFQISRIEITRADRTRINERARVLRDGEMSGLPALLGSRVSVFRKGLGTRPQGPSGPSEMTATCTRKRCVALAVGFHNFNLRIFNLRVSNPNKWIVDVFLTRCRILMCQGLGPKKDEMKLRKSTVFGEKTRRRGRRRAAPRPAIWALFRKFDLTFNGFHHHQTLIYNLF